MANDDNARKVIGTASAGTGWPNGWLVQHDIRTARKSREKIWQGPVDSVADAFAKALAEKPGSVITVSRSIGSNLAEIRATYAANPSSGGGAPATYDGWKVADDTYSLESVSSSVLLEAAPAFADAREEIKAVRAALERGETAQAESLAVSGAAKSWLGLHAAGCQSYETVAMSYSCIHHLDIAALGVEAVKNEIAGALQNVMKVFAWANVVGTASAPFPEPKWIDAAANGAAKSYEWRCDGVSVSCQGELTISYNYTGLWQWAKALYSGGTWEP